MMRSGCRKAGETFDIFYFGRAQHRDAVIGKISPVVVDAGVAKISWQPESGGEAQAVTAVEKSAWSRRRGPCANRNSLPGRFIRARGVNTHADAGMHGFGLA